MNTTENNKLIAEFLGRKGKKNKLIYAFKNLDYNGQIWFNDSELRFHLDWNWLMEVVEKISHKGIAGGWIADIKDGLINANIEKTFNACIEFIKWYNLQNK